MENNNEVLLRVEHLCQYFKMGRKELKAVDDVSFTVGDGELVGYVGPNGAGKATTIRLRQDDHGTLDYPSLRHYLGQYLLQGTEDLRGDPLLYRRDRRGETGDAKSRRGLAGGKQSGPFKGGGKR